MEHLDREKVLAVLLKRFPRAPLCDIAAAANALVGLAPEFEAIAPQDLIRFECDASAGHFSMRHIESGDVQILCRLATIPE